MDTNDSSEKPKSGGNNRRKDTTCDTWHRINMHDARHGSCTSLLLSSNVLVRQADRRVALHFNLVLKKQRNITLTSTDSAAS